MYKCRFSVLVMDLLALDQIIGDDRVTVQILVVHVDGTDLAVLIGCVIVDAEIQVAAA